MNAPDRSLAVQYADVAAAAERLAGHAHRTPVMTSRTVDERAGADVFFKCENFQRMGAFKFRGAYNAMSRLSPEERGRGVLAYSSGNHAQAVAVAGNLLGIRVTIVMPADAPAVKIDATRGYGAEIVLYDKRKEVREEVAERVARERGLAMIPPFNHPHVIAGQGTAAKELIEEVGPLDYLFVPVSGGGLISGCAVAASHLSPGCKVIGVEPEAGHDATRSFKSKTLQSCHNPDTIAVGDGVRVVAALKSLRLERAGGVVARFGLHADHFAPGREMRRGDRAARDQPAAAHRHEQVVERPRLLDQLLRRRALPGDHVGMIERRDRGKLALARDPLCDFLAHFLALVVEDDFGAVAAGRLYLHGGRICRHHDRDADSKQVSRQRDRLRVISRGVGE